MLVTNDDGARAEGLRRLAAHLCGQGVDVLVAAPERDQSGCGTSRSVADDGLVRTRSGVLPGLDGVPVHVVAAPPGLIVTAACQGAFGPAPQLVVAGINPGANIGPSVLHSGTVGAALTAAHHGRPAVAVSLTHGAPYHWDTALRALSSVLPLLVDSAEVPSPPGGSAGVPSRFADGAGVPRLLNLNVPNVPAHRLAGVRRAGLGRRADARFTVRRLDPGHLRVSHDTDGVRDAGEAALLAAGYATVTALRTVTEDPDAVVALDAEVPR
ncbi:5'/3'-nucleotidase SurE [Actinomadura sp. 9N215]|uniref:5'/3'-nucleotidase SurE n=1 Tax=Actinomadura sp. 9N215 TaxID=3375150 RepID=UPI0037B77A37